MFECDRVSLIVRRGRGFRLMAVSGVDTPNRRAELTRRLEKLCKAAAKVDEPLWFPSERNEHPTELEKLLGEYVDESHARSVGIVPLVAESPAAEPPIAILVVEKFFGTFAKKERITIAEASVHIQAALGNCLAVERIPFASILRLCADWRISARGSRRRWRPAPPV